MIAVDMDGVVADFSRAFSAVVQNITHGKAPLVESYDEVKTWSWKSWYWPEGFTDEINEAAWDYVFQSKGFWLSLDPLFPDDMPALAALTRQVPLVFMTRRDGVDSWGQTIRWLHRQDIHEPLVVRVHSGEEKHDLCARMGIKVIVEDSPSVAEACTAAGMAVVLVSWPYNEHVEDVIRVNSLGLALRTAVVIDRADGGLV